jgi:hypothetical protein
MYVRDRLILEVARLGGTNSENADPCAQASRLVIEWTVGL